MCILLKEFNSGHLRELPIDYSFIEKRKVYIHFNQDKVLKKFSTLLTKSLKKKISKIKILF